MSLVDSHCHLDDHRFNDDRQAAVERAVDSGVTRMVSIGTGEGPPDLEVAVRLADRFAPVYATVGVHPQDAARCDDAALRRVEELLRHPKVVALGEIGIDYYWKPFDRDLQHRVFIDQLAIAAAARKPVVIHTRDAWPDTFTLLERHWSPTGLPCVLHCFTGSPAEAERGLALGFYLSFSGVVTYPKAIEVHASAQLAPLDRILVETDCPYLAPVPFRGKRNEPSYVTHNARFIAELRGESYETIAAATTANWERLFAP